MSPDGRFIAFVTADDLLAGDTNQVSDVFLRDRQAGTLERISVAVGGGEANGVSAGVSVSADGRYVAFGSSAGNLVTGDTNGASDIFVRDRQTGTTARVSVATGGAQATGGSTLPTISADGRYVAFLSQAPDLVAGDTNVVQDVFVHDRQTGTTTRVSVATGGAEGTGASGSVGPALSADGRYVAFESTAPNLVAGDTNNTQDIFRRDLQTGTTIRVSVGAGGAQGTGTASFPAISANGQFVAFDSFMSTLVAGDTNGHRDVFVHDVAAATTTRVSVATGGGEATGGSIGSGRPTISTDGRYVAFHSDDTNLVPGDTNGFFDVFVHDRNTATTTRESVVNGGGQANGASLLGVVSATGQFVLFQTSATNLVVGDTNSVAEIYLRDRTGGSTARMLQRSDGTQVLVEGALASTPSISDDGRWVAYTSTQTTLVPDDTNGAADIFVYDRQGGTTARVSVSTSGAQSSGNPNASPFVSATGRYVAFISTEAFVPADTNSANDVFLRDLQTGTTSRISITTGGVGANGNSVDPAVSADGRFVVFTSNATNFVAGDTNTNDIFIRDTQLSTTTRVSTGIGGVVADGPSARATVTPDGRFVVFDSTANNLVSGDSGLSDVFLLDRQSGVMSRVSVATGGAPSNGSSSNARVSSDGRFVVFMSSATNLAAGAVGNHLYRFDRQTNTTTQVDILPGGIQPNGTAVLATPAVSNDGRYVAFRSGASNLVAGALGGLFIRDMVANTFVCASMSTSGLFAGGLIASAVSMSGDGASVVFASTSAVLVPGDTNRQGDVFVSSPGVLDEDGDGLPTAFENKFGLDPVSAAGANGASGDPDGDGLTNLEEYAAGTHPRGTVVRYLAEGANSDFFQTFLAIVNPGTSQARVLFRFLKTGGQSTSYFLNLPAGRRASVEPKGLPGMEQAEFSTVIESDALVVVDRTMLWDGNGYGAHAETAVRSPSKTWYLAEGSTAGGFQLFYLLQNPSLTAFADVEVNYLLPSGAPVVKTLTLPPNSRTNIWVNSVTEVSSTDVSAVIRVTNGPDIIVERAMYLSGGGQVFRAGHESAGVTAPALNWFLAEGATGDYFDEFVLIANPGADDAVVRATYLLPNGSTLVKDYNVAAKSRFNIWVDEEVFPGLGKALASTAVSVGISSQNGVPVVVERAMWWPGNYFTWFETHNSAGATETGTKWALAEGEVGGATNVETYVLVANTSTFAGSVKVTLVFEDGTSTSQTYNVPAQSRFNVNVRAFFPTADGRSFGTIVESLGQTPAQIVVERAMYADSGADHWAAGTNALATKLQ